MFGRHHVLQVLHSEARTVIVHEFSLDVVKVPTSFLGKVWILGGYTCPGTLVCCQVEEQPEPTSLTGCEQK